MNKTILMKNGEDVVFNGEAKKVLVTDGGDLNYYFDDRFIESDFCFDTGNIFEYQGYKWIAISQVRNSLGFYKGKIRRSNYSVKFVIEGKVYEFDAIIDGLSYSVQSNPVISTLEGDVEVIIPSDVNSDKIITNMRFIKMGQAWKVLGSNKTRLGLNILQCKRDGISEGIDDVENEIADSDKIIHVVDDDENNDNETTNYFIYECEWFEYNPDAIYEGEIYEIIAKLYDEDDALINPQPTFDFSIDNNEAVVFIEQNDNTLSLKTKFISCNNIIKITVTDRETTYTKTFTILR